MTSILVTGATGNTGAPLVRNLLDAGAPVRAMVRSADAPLPDGVERVLADFDDTASIDRALLGVEHAYLVTPSSEQAEAQQLHFVERAAAAGVGQIVLLSQLAAAVESPVRFLRYHAVVENRIRELGLGFTFLRPNLFLQGLLAFAGPIRATGSFGAPIGDATISAVDVLDICEVAAAALTDERHLGRTYTLTGPAAVTHAEIAAALSAATGRHITFADTDPQTFAAALDGVMPTWQIDGLVEDYAHYSRGEAAGVSSSVRDVTGHDPRSLMQFARANAEAFRA